MHYLHFLSFLFFVTPQPPLSQRSFVTAAVTLRGFLIPTTVTRAPVSVRVWRATPVCSVRTARRITSQMAPVAANPVPATPMVQWTPSVTGEAAFSVYLRGQPRAKKSVCLFCQHNWRDTTHFCVSLVNQISFAYIFTVFLPNCGIKCACCILACFSLLFWFSLTACLNSDQQK